MAINSNLQIYATAENWVDESAAFIYQKALLSLTRNDRFLLSLAGGSTPKKVYERLALPPFDKVFPWAKTFVFWGDERSVPADHIESNYRMAKEALLQHVDIPQDQIFAVDGADDPERAAVHYQRVIAEILDGDQSFDLTLLGLGTDGHTASLFPGTSILTSKEKVAAVHVPKLNTSRISLTCQLINASRNVVFLVMGESKADIVREVMGAVGEPAKYPAQMIKPDNGNLYWLLDQSAAKHLIQRD